MVIKSIHNAYITQKLKGNEKLNNGKTNTSCKGQIKWTKY